MKKIFLLCAFILCAFKGYTQDAKFGVTAGYLYLNATSTYPGSEPSENGSGFFAGISGEFQLFEALHIEPGAIYGNALDSNILFFPLHFKYYIGQSGFNLIAGPQATMLLDEINPRIKRLGLDLSLGGGYDLTEDIFLRVRYAFEISNRHNDEIIRDPAGVSTRLNTLFAGVGYKF